MIRRDGGICHLCGLPGANTADHIHPYSQGGATYDEDNLRAAHIHCNRKRGARPVATARAQIAAEQHRSTTWTW